MKGITTLLLLGALPVALSFSPATLKSCINNNNNYLGKRYMTQSKEAVDETTDETTTTSVNDSLEIPLTYDEMIKQVSLCMSDAYEQGITRQIVRILLPRDASNDQLGQYFENEVETNDRTSDVKLVPNDESWQGGIMQLYRSASPTTKDILRSLCKTSATTGVPPTIIEDRSIDESGVDGIGLLYTQSGSSGSSTDDTAQDNNSGGGFNFFGESVKLPTLSDNDMCIFVQPSQEVCDVIDDLTSKTDSSQLLCLLNPQWRNVDDALDSASKSDNVFGQFASFLGGKGSVLRRLDELEYRPTYTLEGYVCKGGNIRLIRRFDSDWQIFAENDNGDKYVKVGSMKDRPTYQDVEKLLDEKGVGYKYARDLGMAPKL